MIIMCSRVKCGCLNSLVNLQSELWHEGVHPLHYLGEMMFVSLPFLLLEEEVNLDGQTVFGGVELAHKECSVCDDVVA